LWDWSADGLLVASRLPRVVVLGGSPAELDIMRRQIPADRYEVLTFEDPERAATQIARMEVEVVIADEDHPTGSGLDWLFEVRRSEPRASLILLASPDHALDLAVDAINRAYVRKLLTKPVDPVELVEELDDAARSYTDDVYRERKLRLSTVKVRRLTRSYEQVCRDLVRKSREVHRLQITQDFDVRAVALTELPPAANDLPGGTAELESAMGMGFLELLAESIECARIDEAPPGSIPLRRLVEHCGSAMAWPDDEVREVALAAAVHHALLADHPDERGMGFGRARHARRIADRLDQLPGTKRVAAMVRHHHLPWNCRDEAPDLPRGTWLLQVVSLFDDWTRDPAHEKLVANDPDVGLTRASNRVLQHAGGSLNAELAESVIKRFIPEFLAREETCISLAELEPGQVLSRTVYAENLILVGTGTSLDARAIAKLTDAADQLRSHEVWVEGNLGRTRRRLQKAQTLPSSPETPVEPVR